MIVSPNMTVFEVIRGFSEEFPFLRLEIYCQGQEATTVWLEKPLFALSRLKEPLDVYLQADMPVFEVVESFWQNMGLQVVIFRRVGNSWLETSFTGNWTLEHQNNMGSAMVSVWSSGT